MTRFVSLVLSLLVCSTLVAAVPIAPLEPRLGDMPFDDISPSSASDNVATLAVWVNAFAPYPETHKVYAALLSPNGEVRGSPFLVQERAITPVVASNGSEFLVAYAYGVSRFNTFEHPAIAVRVIHHDGTLGPEKVISSSTYNYSFVSSVAWAGDHWVIEYNDPQGHLAFLDAELEAKYPAIDLANPSRLVHAGDRFSLVRSMGQAIAIDQLTKNVVTPLSSVTIPDATNMYVASAVDTGSSIVVAFGIPSESNVTMWIITFSPERGWSEPVRMLNAFFGLASIDGKATYLRGSGKTLSATPIKDDGTVGAEFTLLTSPTEVYAAKISDRLLFVSRQSNRSGFALYAIALPGLGPVDAADEHLVSVAALEVQSRPLICSAGSYAVAFWNQTIDNDGNVSAFSRHIDATGNPVTEPVQLSFTIGRDARIACGAHYDVITSSDATIAITSDGALFTEKTGPLAEQPRVAAAGDDFFAAWSDRWKLYGTPLHPPGSLTTWAAPPLLPSIRPQSDPEIAQLGENFIAVWLEDSLVGSMLLSTGGAAAVLRTIGSDGANRLTIDGDAESALAGWLSDRGAPLLVPIHVSGTSFDLFDPHWGSGYTAMKIKSAGSPSHYFVGLIKENTLIFGRTGQQGAFLTELGVAPAIRDVGSPFDFVAVSHRPVAIWQAGNRILVGGAALRQRAVIH